MTLTFDDRSLLSCLLRVAQVYKRDKARTAAERSALQDLIDTYRICASHEPSATTAGRAFVQGNELEQIREHLAKQAGIGDLAQLAFFAGINARLANGELQTTSLAGLTEDEIIRLS